MMKVSLKMVKESDLNYQMKQIIQGEPDWFEPDESDDPGSVRTEQLRLDATKDISSLPVLSLTMYMMAMSNASSGVKCKQGENLAAKST